MQQQIPPTPSDDPAASSLFNWSDFLDFNLDENESLNTPFQFDTGQLPESSGRLRKRDPRLVCSNFLAGRIPCACPELDEKLEEESGGLPGKKRLRTARGGAPARCQVPGCEVDISELKGYHKRHRVCLQCANASSVVIDGEVKRYCQQCGKFHILSDFDDDKRSCRRKLERHNNRRRRKQNDSKDGPEKESQQTTLVDDLSGDDDAGKDGICVTSQNEERERLLESDVQVSALISQNLQSDSVVSFTASGETQIEGDNMNPKLKHSPSYLDNKSSFSSLCPAGRISFKLYDWNPAEFPRRLRLQIFQWLASMPVELEGYIRPGCTILTAFIAMPRPQWHKLMDEPTLCIKDLVASHGSLLAGRGTMHVYLNDMIFRITKDATSVLKVKVKDQAPKLHYIFPNCFEAGKPMEFVACGTHLLQTDFRFLISFSGQYLPYDIRISSLDCEKGDANHQLLKIYVPQIDTPLSGPAFIEVENQSGLSNFVPILIGDKETCAEMEELQQKTDSSLSSNEHTRPPCEVFASNQAEISELILDVAWLLKKPSSERQLTSCQIQRSSYLLEYLIKKDSSIILEKLVSSLRLTIDNNSTIGCSDPDLSLLLKHMDTARRRLTQKSIEKESGNCYDHSSRTATNQGLQKVVKNILGLTTPSPPLDATVPLLNGEVIMNVNLEEKPRNRSLTRAFFTSRPLIMAVMAVGVCSGVCAVVLHPQRIDQIATTIHRCLFDNS